MGFPLFSLFAHGSPLYPEAVLCPSETNTPSPSPLYPSLPPHPLSLVSYSLSSVPLGHINLPCAENLVLGCLVLTSRSFQLA